VKGALNGPGVIARIVGTGARAEPAAVKLARCVSKACCRGDGKLRVCDGCREAVEREPGGFVCKECCCCGNPGLNPIAARGK
jgi:hypothetical protein